jgi:hypothetical protein
MQAIQAGSGNSGRTFSGLICPAQGVIILPSTGLYSDVTSADKPHEPESIEVNPILTVTMLLLPNDELQNHAIERKKIPEPSFGKAPIFLLVLFSIFMKSWDR